MFIPVSLIILVGAYIGSFAEEFDKDVLKSAWAVVGCLALLLLLGAVLTSLGGGVLPQR